MAKQVISSSDSGSVAAGKINDNFTELYNNEGGDVTPSGVIALNEDAIQRISAAKQHFDARVNSANVWTTNTAANCFVLAHGTDFHNDAARYGRFRDVVDAVGLIDAAIVTGDITDKGKDEEFASMNSVEFSRITPLMVIGNHERQDGKTIAAIGEKLSQPKVNNAYTGYYYVDYPTQKIRIIVLNEYDTSVTTSETAQKDGHWTQTQIDWFIGALDGAITGGYSVLVSMHCTEQGSSTSADAIPTSNNNGFFQRSILWTNNFSTAMPHHIIEDIIHAFRNKSTISGSYSHVSGDANGTITINPHTFGGNGKFVAYVVGHAHVDMIGFSKYKSDQLYLACPMSGLWGGLSGTSESHRFFGGEVSDLPRIEGTKSEDCFNIYGIDTINKLIKVIRVGSDMNDMMEPREVACFEYEPTINS